MPQEDCLEFLVCPRSSTDRIQTSEVCDTGSIPVEDTNFNINPVGFYAKDTSLQLTQVKTKSDLIIPKLSSAKFYYYTT